MSNDVPALEEVGAYADSVSVGELKDFLARPRRISNLSWTPAEALGVKTTLDPWSTLLNIPSVIKKVDNFAWFRANLKIKVVVTASPFYYGLMMLSYKPVPGFAPTDNFAVGLGITPRSQRPHIMILPADSLGGEMTLPFVYPANFVSLTEGAKVNTLGLLTYEIISPLQSANGAVGQPVSVQTYAWFEDVDMQGPSIGLALQSKEVKTGPVSSVASSVAKLANVFTTWPFVGKFAKATEIGAGAIGDIASMFGFTNLPVLLPAQPVRSVPFPPLASTGIGYPVEKLTADPHAELAIDGAPCNLSLDDELQISSLVQRSAYLTKASWTTATLVDAQLFRANVTPYLFQRETTAARHAFYFTPMAWVGSVFNHWRGDIIYRFDFIKSKYHRGRVIITWDPISQVPNNVSQVADVMGRTITKIVDLGATSSVELRVPYAQNFPWCAVNPSSAYNYVTNGTDIDPAYVRGDHNGTIVMRVMNVLTAPVASSQIDVIVTVRGAENLEFNNPKGPPFMSPWEPQSKEVFDTPAEYGVMGSLSQPAKERYVTTMGESFKSVRELMRRTMLNETWEEPTDITNQLGMIEHIQKRFPPAYGYDPNGLWTAKGIIAPATDFPFNYVNNTYYNWFAPAFIGVRGSMFWTYNVTNQSAGLNTPMPVRVSRTHAIQIATRTRRTQAVKTGANDAYFWWLNGFDTGTGAALTTTTTQQGLAVSIPNYNPALFCSTDQGENTFASGRSIPIARDIDGAVLSVQLHPAQGQTTRGLTIGKYCGVGTDFSLQYFLNVPVWFNYLGSTAP
nr:MAG: capsid protein [Picornaviridae sp.]